MKVRRETLLIILLMVILVGVTGAAAYVQARRQGQALSSNSNADDGALAIRLWLDEAGYQVNNRPSTGFTIPAGTAALLILQPSALISTDEWTTLNQWVQRGGILYLVASNWGDEFDGNPFKLSSLPVDSKEYDLLPPAPIFRSPPTSQPAHLTVDQVLRYAGTDSLAILTIEQGAVAWQIHLGKGQVMAVAEAGFITNSGLKQTGNAELAMNLLAQIPQGGQVFIDEWHHGEKVDNPSGTGFEAWLTQTPGGLALLFAAAVVFLGLLLAGRPFGRRIALPKAQARRGMLEYINAVANLNRRAGHRNAVMDYYRTELKRALANRYRVTLEQANRDFIQRVVQADPALDTAGLTELMQRLDRKNFSESEMVQLGRDCAGWIEKIRH